MRRPHMNLRLRLVFLVLLSVVPSFLLLLFMGLEHRRITIQASFWEYALALGAIGVLVVVAAWFGSGPFFLKRLQALLMVTERLRGGDLSTRANLRMGDDELTQLAQAFDEMAQAIQLREEEITVLNESLEERVKERTTALAGANEELKVKMEELRRLNRVMMDREERILELKEKVRRFKEQLEAGGASAMTQEAAGQRRLEQVSAVEQYELLKSQQVKISLLEDLQMTKERLEQQGRAFQEANQRLEALSALKDEFVALVSHELRTPLTSIKEGVSLIRDEILGPVNAEQADFLHTVDENIDRLTELINNMLDLSKIEAGRLQLNRRKVAARELIEASLKSLKPTVGRRAIHVEVPQLPEVFADPSRILQVLGNLISNAIKFTAEEGEIAISARVLDGQVELSVRDDGIGIVPEDVPRLFQKFSQVTKGETRPRGTGLGLVVCKQLVEMHTGTIAVVSKPKQGSTFTFTLPVYSPQLALEVTFRDISDLAKQQRAESIGIMVIDGQALGRQFEALTEFVQRQMRPMDLVVSVDPAWVVVMAVTDPLGLQTMMQRFRSLLAEWAKARMGSQQEVRLPIGVALSPADGDTAHTLFAKATQGATTRAPHLPFEEARS